MDFEVLFWILILLAPVLSRLLRAQKQREKQQRPRVPQRPRPSQEANGRELTPFEEALQQIQEALAESKRPSAPPVEPAPPQPGRQRQPEPKPVAAFPERTPPEFHAHADPSYEDNPRFYDDRFDKAAPSMAPGRDVHYHAPLSEGDDTPPSPGKKKPKELTKWQRTVADIAVFSPPRSKRPWSGPRSR